MPEKHYLLIDGDIIAYIAACRAQGPGVDWDGDGTKTYENNPEQAENLLREYLRMLMERFEADHAIVALSDPRRTYFRHRIFPDYKKNRTHGEPPRHLCHVRDTIRNNLNMDGIKSKHVTDLEADDVLGILATHPTLVSGRRTILTSDKDLRQIPGHHIRILKNNEFSKPEIVTEANGDYFFWTQCLTGDATDGFPGVPGIGPKKAEKILVNALKHNDPATAWTAILAAYERYYGDEGEQHALTQARVARICRHTDFDFEKGQVKLWTPPEISKPQSD